MSLSGRIILGTAAVTSFAMLAAAALVHWVVRAYLSPFADHFATMRRMMGWGPDLETIYALVDHALAISLGIAVFSGVLLGLLVARELVRSVVVLDQGLARFSRGFLDQPIDLTGPPELTRVAESANHMAEELGGAQRAERELVAGIAHDLAHPLTAMRGTLEAVRDGLTSPSDPRTMARLLTDVGTMETTLADLRDVAAAEVGALRLELHDVDVAAVTGRIAASFADLAARKGIRLELETGVPEPVVARTDERRLARIVANLVVNALQATPPDGRVGVAVGMRDGTAVLRVEDAAGPNAGAAIRAALDGQGSGLGLRVVRVLGRAIGAQLEVQDGEAGAKVELRLPL
ncbi:MAG TPA: HAMP domain-containing sensor histidine kinase [Candidatus Dormibacteraeota bacterium]|nr:HAMP domain-containing sensor histidine kinase [Candidatus Dormibacteraeota bacterium]